MEQPSHKTFMIKKKLAKKMRQNRPIPHWIRMRTDNTIRSSFILIFFIYLLYIQRKAQALAPHKAWILRVGAEWVFGCFASNGIVITIVYGNTREIVRNAVESNSGSNAGIHMMQSGSNSPDCETFANTKF
ncbi:hypothetical protein CUMW_093070 [Citrus unshiu]|nr:hypothetical protein CUMW_093070 [Citrus unshiu]